jgi:hypothetical protein
MKRFLIALNVVIWSLVAFEAKAESGIYKKESYPLKWETCVVKVHEMTKKVPSRVLVSTDVLVLVRHQTAEGSMLVSCSKPDAKIALIHTTNPL